MKEVYKRYYDGGRMSAEQVRKTVKLWKWTPLDYEYITGLPWKVDEV